MAASGSLRERVRLGVPPLQQQQQQYQLVGLQMGIATNSSSREGRL
jgi:hypothetical protein